MQSVQLKIVYKTVNCLSHKYLTDTQLQLAHACKILAPPVCTCPPDAVTCRPTAGDELEYGASCIYSSMQQQQNYHAPHGKVYIPFVIVLCWGANIRTSMPCWSVYIRESSMHVHAQQCDRGVDLAGPS